MFITKYYINFFKIILIGCFYSCLQGISFSCADVNFISTLTNLKNEPDASKCPIDGSNNYVKNPSIQDYEKTSSFTPTKTIKQTVLSTIDKVDEQFELYHKFKHADSEFRKKISDNRLYSIIYDITKRKTNEISPDEISQKMTRNDMEFNLSAVSSIANESIKSNHTTMATFLAGSSFESSHNFNAESSRTDSLVEMSISSTTIRRSSSKSDLNKISTDTFLDAQHYNEMKYVDDESTASETATTESIMFTNSTPDETVAGMGNIPLVESSHEDIPSFREWTEKHLAEEEKERGDENNTTITPNTKIRKVRNKNYASLDCGAKLLMTNPEAKSAGSFLSASRDEYLLSVCNTKIWFVVELCEALQLKKIELANFELFSSSPRDFVVYSSDRFPSRDWTILGQFQARDEKSVQSFDVQPHHFTKYVKVEFHSHYGHEHFCPISLFRVYGTSEFEVLETVDGSVEQILNIDDNEDDDIGNDDDVNEPIMSIEKGGKKRKSEASNNLFGSARDAVMNIVKKAAEVLVINPHWNQSASNVTSSLVPEDTKHTQSFLDREYCITPRYTILCYQCDESLLRRVYRAISCHIEDLAAMLESIVIWKPLVHYNVCRIFGITSLFLLDDTRSEKSYGLINDFYAIYLLPQDIIAALCNVMVISDNQAKQNLRPAKGRVNIDFVTDSTTNEYDNASVVDAVSYQSVFTVPMDKITSRSEQSRSHKIANHSTMSTRPQFQYIHPEADNLSSQIKPTQTFVDSDISIVTDHLTNTGAPNIKEENKLTNHTKIAISEGKNNATPAVEHGIENVEDTMSLDSLIYELEKSEYSQPNSVQTSTPKPTSQKESVFVRLANRIKALERNMSLSGQYLEELSRRYKKQIEDMQRMLSEIADDRYKSAEREAKLHREISILNSQVSELTSSVDNLVGDRESWSSKVLMVGEHSLILFLEIFILVFIVCLCRGIPSVEISKRKFSLEWYRNMAKNKLPSNNTALPKKVQSANDLNSTNCSSWTHKRRPSEEALKSGGSTHHDLLIYDTHCTSKAGRRRKKRKELVLKSNANAINLETGDALLKMKSNTGRCNQPLSRSASVSEITDETAWKSPCGEYEMFQSSDFTKISVENSSVSAFAPSFQTATSSQMKHLSSGVNDENDFSFFRSKASDQESASSTPLKERKINGIRKIVKKLF